MKKIIPFITCLCIPFLLTSCYPENSWLGKPVKTLVNQMTDDMTAHISWNASLLWVKKEGIYTRIPTEEGKNREKITTDFIKSLRKDYISKKLTCEQKQLNLETNYKTYVETAKQRNWLLTGAVSEFNYDISNETFFKNTLDQVSYPCSSFQKEKLRHDILGYYTGRCYTKNSGAPILCEDTRKILEKYDKEFLELINKYGVDNLYDNTPKGLILKSL